MLSPWLAVLLALTFAAPALSNDEVRSEMRWTQAKLKGELTTTDSGLQYLDVKVGKGPLVESGDSAKVMYKLYGADSGGGKHGRHIYSQSSPASAFDLTAGAGSVIKGFDEAVLGPAGNESRRASVCCTSLGHCIRGRRAVFLRHQRRRRPGVLP